MKLKSGSLSTKTVTGEVNLLEPTFPQDIQLLATFHQKCETLIYDIFTKILVTSDYNLLTITGSPKKSDLVNAWMGIMQEYSDLIKTEKSINIFEAWKKCVYTYWKMVYVENFIFKCKLKNPITGLYCYNAAEAEQVMLLGYDLIEPPAEDEEKYLHQIEMLDRESKTLVVMLNQYNQEYKLLAPDETNPIIRTIADYDKELALLSKFMGYQINKRVVTVSEVCGIINAFIETQKINNA